MMFEYRDIKDNSNMIQYDMPEYNICIPDLYYIYIYLRISKKTKTLCHIYIVLFEVYI